MTETQVVKSNGLVRPCCMPGNTVRIYDPRRPDVVIDKCRTCGARHISLDLKPGRLWANPPR